jgi:hypothetical protein
MLKVLASIRPFSSGSQEILYGEMPEAQGTEVTHAHIVSWWQAPITALSRWKVGSNPACEVHDHFCMELIDAMIASMGGLRGRAQAARALATGAALSLAQRPQGCAACLQP